MKRPKTLPKRIRRLVLCCTAEEFEEIKARWKKSTSQNFSEYTRKLLLSQPVTMTSRNLSLDNLIDTINETRAELKRLLESPAFTPEEKDTLFSLTKDIRQTFNQIADLCIPK